MAPGWATAAEGSVYVVTAVEPSNANLDRERIAELHRLQDEAVEAARATSPPRFEGAGIVIVAGGPRCFTNAWVALTMLRNVLGCDLPIQVWHLGPQEISPGMRRLIARFDVDLVDALDVRMRHPVRRLGPWECKSYAIRHSQLRHVVLIDADNVPLVDPAALLNLPQYRAFGAIFWPDNQSHPQASPVWKLFRVPYRQELEVESGQIVIDKERCWVPLNLALHFNEWSDMYYRYVYGDKETFHFAWRQLDQPYAMPEGRPRIVHCHWDTPDGRKRMTAALEQRDFDGTTIFHHRTGAEWALFGENPPTGRPNLDAICADALETLRAEWDGRITSVAPAAEIRLPGGGSGAQHVLYRRLGVEERVMELEPNGHIGTGATQHERSWRIEQYSATRTLTIAGDEGDTCRLTVDNDGIWRGRCLWYQRVPVEMVPLDAAVDRPQELGRR